MALCRYEGPVDAPAHASEKWGTVLGCSALINVQRLLLGKKDEVIYWNPPASLPRSCPPGLAEVFTASVAAQPGRLLQGRLLLKGSGVGPWLRALLVRSIDVLLGAALCEAIISVIGLPSSNENLQELHGCRWQYHAVDGRHAVMSQIKQREKSDNSSPGENNALSAVCLPGFCSVEL
ncbi:unnamed protein product [Gadus morhua 'NCC']